MTDLTRIEERFRMANPIPDPANPPLSASTADAALLDLEERGTMDIKQAKAPTPNRAQDKRRIGAIVATAAVALIVVIGALALVRGNDSDVATGDFVATGVPEVDVVYSAIEALNRGDVETYMASLTGAELDWEETLHIAEAFSYANATTELVGCTVTGTRQGDASIVACESTTTDDFYSAGGIVNSGTMTFAVTEDGRISRITNPRDEGPWTETEFAAFNLGFFTWLRDAHPGVFDDIAFATPNLDSIPGLGLRGDPHEAAEMLIALEYVDEFVNQSDVYPIDP